MPFIEITVARDTLNREQQLRMAEAVQKSMIREFEEIKDRTPGSYVIVREVAKGTWLSTKPRT